MPRQAPKYPSTAPAGRDIALWWTTLEQEYNCTLDLSVYPARQYTSRGLWYYRLTVSFPSNGVLEPLQLEVRDQRVCKRPGDLEAVLFPLIVRMYNMVEAHPQAKFWRLAPPFQA